MVNEGGITPATLLHLSFHNKCLSLGKPKQVTPTMGAAQDAAVVWYLRWERCPPAALPAPAGKGTRLPPHTRPQELIRLTNNPAKPSQANQTFCGQVSILSAAVWSSCGHQHTGASARRAQRARGPRFCSEQPQTFVISQRSHQEQNTTEQGRGAAAAVRGYAGTDPSPAQPANVAAAAAGTSQWQLRHEAEGSPEAPISCSLSRSNCCLPASQSLHSWAHYPTENYLFFFSCCVIPWVLFLSAYWNGSAKNGERSSVVEETPFSSQIGFLRPLLTYSLH